jgi:hypothetical protein
MCDTGPDVRRRELSEGFVTSPRARTLRGRAEHPVRVPSCVRARLEVWLGPLYLDLECGYKCTESCGLASPMYFRELFVVLGVVSPNILLYLRMSRSAMCSIFVLLSTKMARGGVTRWSPKEPQAALF